jgi:1-acyl-sn-glycerol-3-phosphate acyltransferase
MRRAGRRLRRSLWLVAHLALGALLCAFWLAPLARLRPRTALARRARVVRGWMRALVRGLGVRVHCAGAIHPAPVLVVANHISWLDIPCLFACTDGVFVAKSDVARWPLIGTLAASIGTLFLARGQAASATADRMTWLLAQGERVVIFPEGTSTDGARVGVFHARLFQAAVRAGSVVQAVAIHYPHVHESHPMVPFVGDDEFVQHLWRLIGEETIEAQIRYCAPLSAAGQERRALAAQSRRQICNALGLEAKVLQATH